MNKAQIIWLIVMVGFVVMFTFMELNTYRKVIGITLLLLS